MNNEEKYDWFGDRIEEGSAYLEPKSKPITENKQPDLKSLYDEIMELFRTIPEYGEKGKRIYEIVQEMYKLSDGQEKGMRWVRVSERLPGKHNHYYVKTNQRFRGENMKEITWFENSQWVCQEMSGNIIVEEWLDESPSTESYKEERIIVKFLDSSGEFRDGSCKFEFHTTKTIPEGKYYIIREAIEQVINGGTIPQYAGVIVSSPDNYKEENERLRRALEAAKELLSCVPVEPIAGRSNIYLPGFATAVKKWRQVSEALKDNKPG